MFLLKSNELLYYFFQRCDKAIRFINSQIVFILYNLVNWNVYIFNCIFAKFIFNVHDHLDFWSLASAALQNSNSDISNKCTNRLAIFSIIKVLNKFKLDILFILLIFSLPIAIEMLINKKKRIFFAKWSIIIGLLVGVFFNIHSNKLQFNM